MDFQFTSAQQEVESLARDVFARCEQRVAASAESRESFETHLWSDLAASGLLSVAIAEEHAGFGAGFLELCSLLQVAGEYGAHAPLFETLVLGAWPISEFGTRGQREHYLPRVAAGECMLTAALAELGSFGSIGSGSVYSESETGLWRLHGTKVAVSGLATAERVLVPAVSASGEARFFLVPQRSEGIVFEEQRAADGAHHNLTLADAPVHDVDVLGGRALLDFEVDRVYQSATVAACALQCGLAAAALRLTTDHTTHRRQFGRPVATFQAVQQSLANAYIDLEAIRWTMWQAAWRLSQNLPAAEATAVAKFWASEGGQRVLQRAHHLHGGVGVDLAHALPRYFSLSRRVDVALGSAEAQLAKLGVLIAEAR